MNTKEKEFAVLAAIIGAVLLFWYLWERKQKAAAAESGPAPEQDFGNWPMDVNGDQYAPQAVPEINIANQTPNLLTNQYIPLFGFVGMAQGTYYH